MKDFKDNGFLAVPSLKEIGTPHSRWRDLSTAIALLVGHVTGSDISFADVNNCALRNPARHGKKRQAYPARLHLPYGVIVETKGKTSGGFYTWDYGYQVSISHKGVTWEAKMGEAYPTLPTSEFNDLEDAFTACLVEIPECTEYRFPREENNYPGIKMFKRGAVVYSLTTAVLKNITPSTVVLGRLVGKNTFVTLAKRG